MHKFRPRLARPLCTCAFLLLTITAIAQSVPPELVNGLKWRLIGPFRGGRAVAVAGVPGDSTTFYFGSVNGGVWKTTDAGVVWTPIFDGQPVASIGALAVAPSDSKIIYAGTGETDIREDLSSGNDVYKSSDSGATWNHIGRGMPCLGRPQHRFAPLGKTALKNINVDCCIVEQLGGSITGRSNELKLRFGPRSELCSMFVGFEPPESALKFRTQAQPRYQRCRVAKAASPRSRR